MSITNNFFANINNKYSKSDVTNYAKYCLKQSVDVGKAIVSVLSNTGISGFKFNIPQTEQVKMESEVTDHYTDINSAVQDHIAKKPVTITLSGLEGEYFYSLNPIEDALGLITPTLSLIKQFLPKLDAAVMQFKAKKTHQVPKIKKNADGTMIIEAEVSANKKDFNAIEMFTLFQDLYKLKSAQTRAFLFFQAMWDAQAIFSVETTWRRYDNMVITSIIPVRDNNADITEFTLTFKQLSFTQSETLDLKGAGRVLEQNSPVVNKGIEKGKEVADI